jgi:hypothetical protein
MIVKKEIEFDINVEVEGDSNTVTVSKWVEVEIEAEEIIFAIEKGEFDDDLEELFEVIKERIGDTE